MGLGDILFGKKKLKGAKLDKLFALSTAQVTLETELGLRPAGAAAVVFKPLSAATASSSSTSRSTRANSPAESGLKTTAATPAGRRPSSDSSVTCAVESAKSLSSFAPLSFFLPKRMSPRPKA